MLKVIGKQKMLFVLAGLLLLVVLGACGGGSEGHDSNDDKQLYTCGMDPQVIQAGPGTCPICGMKLVPLKTGTAAAVTGEERHSEEEHTAMKMFGQATDHRSEQDKKILYWRAPMDATYTSDKPGKSPMGMDLIPVYNVASGSTISIDPVTVQNMGVRTAIVARQPFYRIIRTVGHVDYDEETLYSVNLKFHGWIEKLNLNRTGDIVKIGQPLLEIYSPELVATQEEYLLAVKNQKKLSLSSFSEVTEGATNLVDASRQRLKFWDISDSEIQRIEKTGEVSKTLTIFSPVKGVVIHKNAVQGTYVKAGTDLFRIADLSKVWVLAHIFEYELPWIKLGQEVVMELPYVPGKRFKGKVDYIYPYLNENTRDVRLRLVFDNPNLELKPQMYANITIESLGGENELVIPSEAIIRSGKRNVVFVDLGNGKFRPQNIIIGAEGDNGLVKVVAGLQEGERIVTSAQFLLDSESRLREVIQKMLASKKKSMIDDR